MALEGEEESQQFFQGLGGHVGAVVRDYDENAVRLAPGSVEDAVRGVGGVFYAGLHGVFQEIDQRGPHQNGIGLDLAGIV